jgi:hypothetical protein
MIPGGLGPWFCSLLFNTSEKCKKQTHLVAHTFPHLALDALNKKATTTTTTAIENCWVMMIKIGPFERWEECVSFLNLWTTKTRGKTRRLERGVELFKIYHARYALKMWVQTKTKQQVVEEYASTTQTLIAAAAAAAAAAAVVIKEENYDNVEEEDTTGKEHATDVVVSKRTVEDMFLTDTTTTTVINFKKVHDAIEKSKKRARV